MDTDDGAFMRDEFPDLRIDDDQDPFHTHIQWGSPTAQHIFACSLIACGATSLDELRDRLSCLRSAVVKVLDDAGNSGVEPFLYGVWISPQDDPGLMVAILTDAIDQAEYPVFELQASLAVWLMLEARRALPEAVIDEINHLVIQASICLAYCFGEGGRQVVLVQEKARRSEIATHAADVAMAAQRERKRRLLDEFAAGSWENKTVAARVLSKKHCFSEATVRKWLQGR